ncbi:hypothetical protein HN51_024160 [Arachis hypogaea]
MKDMGNQENSENDLHYFSSHTKNFVNGDFDIIGGTSALTEAEVIKSGQLNSHDTRKISQSKPTDSV